MARTARSTLRPHGAGSRAVGQRRRLGARLGDRLGARLADQQLRAQRAAAPAGRAPGSGRSAVSARRARRPSSRRRAARARWRSRSASRRRRCCARRPARGGRRPAARYSSESTSTTASPPRAATRRPCSTACSTAWACASGEAANETAATGGGPLGPLGDLLGAHAGEHDAHLEPLAAGQRGGDPRAAPRSCRRARAAGDHHARALAERRQPLDRLDGRVLGAELEALGRERGGQVLEAACPRRPRRPGGR